jgi:predicted PurR-regulated permease PerM
MTARTKHHAAVAPIPRALHIVSWILTGAALLATVALHLLGALLAGLLVYQLVHILAGAVHIPYLRHRYAKILFVGLLGVLVVTLLTLAGVGIAVFLRKGPDNLAAMLTQMGSIVEDLRRLLPAAAVPYLPTDADGMKREVAAWFRDHAAEVRTLGTEALRVFAHVIVGLIIGAMVALHEATPHAHSSPLARALSLRAQRLSTAFRRILLAQVPISLINTTLTAIYLTIALPLFDVDLPFKKTLIALTFTAGLLPVIGNLISNTAIFLVSLTHSFGLAAVSLVYLVVIHKLEYFLNARIVGTRINAKAWELLIAMLVFEAAFGLAGLIMAPLVYAYVKHELAEEGML